MRQGKDANQAISQRRRAAAQPDAHVSGALRRAYDEAVHEDIPAEFLDLLGKLK